MGATLSCLAASEPGTLESRSDSALQFSGRCKVRVQFQDGVGVHRFVCWTAFASWPAFIGQWHWRDCSCGWAGAASLFAAKRHRSCLCVCWGLPGRTFTRCRQSRCREGRPTGGAVCTVHYARAS